MGGSCHVACYLQLINFVSKILYNRDKLPYDIIVGITFQTDEEIPMKFLEIIFKKNKQINKTKFQGIFIF